MKYNLRKDLLDHNNILSHLFLSSLPKEMVSEIAAQRNVMSSEQLAAQEIDIEVLINGVSVNPKAFFDKFSEQYEDMLKRHMMELWDNNKSNVFSKLDEISEVLDAWSKDINWDVKNPFLKQEQVK